MYVHVRITWSQPSMPTPRAKPYSLYGPESAGPRHPPEVQPEAASRLKRGNRTRKKKERTRRKRGTPPVEGDDSMLAGGRGRRSRAGLRVEEQSTLLHPCVAASSVVGAHERRMEVLEKLKSLTLAKPSRGRNATIVRL